MAIASLTGAHGGMSALATADIDITRLYRAHVSPHRYPGIELTAFVEAGTHTAGMRKIAGAIAAMEYRTPEEVFERIYNCSLLPS